MGHIVSYTLKYHSEIKNLRQDIQKSFCLPGSLADGCCRFFLKRCHLSPSPSSFPFCILIIIVSKVLKDFPLFHGNSDMLDNLMDFSPRDKNKLIFRGKRRTHTQPSLSLSFFFSLSDIYKWVTYRVPLSKEHSVRFGQFCSHLKRITRLPSDGSSTRNQIFRYRYLTKNGFKAS